MAMKCYLFISMVSSFCFGNVWDNVFGHVNAPLIDFPSNFSFVLTYKNITDILIEGSKELGIAKLSILNKNRSFILNITENYMYSIHDDKCSVQNLNTNLIQSEKESTFNLQTFWNLFTFYRGKDQKGLFNFELGDLIKLKIIKSKLRVNFNANKVLDQVIIEDEQDPIILERKQSIARKVFEPNYFRKEIDKFCDMNRVNKIDSSATLESEIKKFLPFKLGNNSNSNFK